jgi:hypothetical protein
VLPQTITVPASAAPTPFGTPGTPGHPTGVVYNPTSDFVISEGGKSAPAHLIFDLIDGTIARPGAGPQRPLTEVVALIKDVPRWFVIRMCAPR